MKHGKRRGYTVVELAVVAVVATGVVLGLVRWLVGVGTVAQGSIRQAAGGDLLLAQAQLRDDLQGVRFCTANGTDARVRLVEPGQVIVTADGDGDGTVDTIGWRISQGRLERSVTPLGTGCAPAESPTWTTWADGMSASSAFYVVADGTAVAGGTDGPCSNEFEARCAIDALGADLSRAGAAAESLGGVFDVAGGRDVVTIGSLTGQLVPGRVAGVLTQAGDEQVTLSWETPTTSGWAVSDYMIEYSTNAGGSWLVFPDGSGSATNVTINGLVNGLSHQFRITATNANGSGLASAPVTATPFPPAGTVLWAAVGGAEGADTPGAVDANGSLVVVGGSYTGDLVLPTQGGGVYSAPTGVFTGLAEADGQDAFVAGLDATNGGPLWAASAGGSGQDSTNGVTVAAGSVLAVGSYEATPGGFLADAGPVSGGEGADAFIAAFGASTGALDWALRGGSTGSDSARGAVLSPDGSVAYVVGEYSGTPTGFLTGIGSSVGGSDAFVVAVQMSNGQVLWKSRAGAEGSDASLAVAIDPNGGTIYVSGFFSSGPNGFLTSVGSASGGTDAYVAALSTSTGQPLWARRGGGPDDDQAAAVYADTVAVYAGGLYRSNATGFLSGLGVSTGATDAWVASFSRASGSVDWTARGGSAGGAEALGGLIASKGRVATGGVYAAQPNGFLSGVAGTSGALDAFIALLDADSGSGLWAGRGGSTAGDDAALDVTASGNGWLYLAGRYLSGATGVLSGLPPSSGGTDVFVIKLSPGPIDGR